MSEQIIGQCERQRLRLLHECVEGHARACPDAIAIEYRGEHVTFRALDQWANGCAESLAKRGVGPEVLVGLAGSRSPALVAGLLGVLKAGGAYVPLDTAYPDDRIEQMVVGAGVRMVLTAGTVAGRWIPLVECIALEVISRADCLPSTVEGDLADEQLAMVLYTSGSSGRPKGIGITHRALALRVNGSSHGRAAEPGCQQFSVGLVAHIWDLLKPLAHGHTVVILEERVLRNVVTWAHAMQAHDVRFTSVGPSRLIAVLDSAEAVRALAGVETIVCGAEPTTPRLLSRLRTALPHVAIVNAYGLTETSGPICGSMGGASTAGVTGEAPVPPLQITDPDICCVRVVDDSGSNAAPGVTGELGVSGPVLARGYWNDPRLTAERFVPDPCGPPGARMFFTRDRGRMSSQGDIDVLGRADLEVKVRGLRVNLEDVERVIEDEDPDVTRAVVVVGESGVMVAHVVVQAGAIVDLRALRVAVSKRLPAYMVPTRMVTRSEVPMLPSGKIDRGWLTADAERLLRSSEGDIQDAPECASEVEETVTAAWRDVLSESGLRTDGDFFDIGGNSLLAMQILARISDRLGVDLLPEDIFENSTREALSALVSERIAEEQNG